MHAKDPQHWLHRFTAREWIDAALSELARAEAAFASMDRKGGLAGCRRAAGMAVNGALACTEVVDARFGVSYMDHVVALCEDATAPESVRVAARLLVQTPTPGGAIVVIRTVGTDERLIDATRTVMAHAYALFIKAQ